MSAQLEFGISVFWVDCDGGSTQEDSLKGVCEFLFSIFWNFLDGGKCVPRILYDKCCKCMAN